jgi:hypothetical protein
MSVIKLVSPPILWLMWQLVCNVEISFFSPFTGDVFEKLEDEDEQGWCKGRKDGCVGLYPANYVEVVSQ